MDWDLAIEINRRALSRIVTALIAMVEIAAEGAMALLPRGVHRAALRILIPAEAAVRRLIVIAARELAVKIRAVRPMPAGLVLATRGGGRASFPLFDPRKRFDRRPRSARPRAQPRVLVFGGGPFAPLFQPQIQIAAGMAPDDGMVNAERLGRRLAAIKSALEDLPAQAKRLARLTARRARIARYKFRSPLRPGRPPGHRKEGRDDVDRVLRECHALAREAIAEDTS